MKRIDLSGVRFGRLTVIGFSHSDGHSIWWDSVCDCGGSKKSRTASFLAGLSSCGCEKAEKSSKFCKKNFTKHGGYGTHLYRVWVGMRRRCNEESHNRYYRYGGRGISVCALWEESFDAFSAWANENGYKDTLQLDRINNDGNYEPVNCRFVTPKEQAANRRKRSPNGYPAYEQQKQKWLASNPEATQQQYEQAMREIAKKAGV